MRIVVDLQGAQTASGTRGIGRYSLSFAKALVRTRGDHDVVLALNGMFPETIEPIRRAFRDLLPRENIRVWYASEAGPYRKRGSGVHRKRAELIREAFLASLEPDVVHITSLFEGFGDSAVASIGALVPDLVTSVTFYDLIPLHHPKQYLLPCPPREEWYYEKLDLLKKADLLLAISEASARDACERLDVPARKIVNVSAACPDVFRPIELSAGGREGLLARFGIVKPFVLVSGTIDPHKNLRRFFQSWARLPRLLRDQYCIVLIGNPAAEHRQILRRMARSAGLLDEGLVLTGHVRDDELVALCNLCAIMAFPSYDEGFGLPVLEAMACGAAAIGASTASIPEVIGREDALFDPFDERSIAGKLQEVLTDASLRKSLKAHGPIQAARFSWDETAKRAIAAMSRLVAERKIPSTGGPLKQGAPLDVCIDAIARLDPLITEEECIGVADSIARSIAPRGRERQLLVDVSELAQRDAKTGCQRVTRSVVLELLNNPPIGFCVEPVFATVNKLGYRYARSFAARLTGEEATGGDYPIDYAPGDVFFGLDYQAPIVAAQRNFLLELKRNGLEVRFLVYDILSVSMPQCFLPGLDVVFSRWLETIALFDGIIGISKATADALKRWYEEQSVELDPEFRFDWVHLGADIENSAPTRGLPDDASEVLKKIGARPTFLMVSTIEPRKGYAQALAAFEALWEESLDANLVIVGKQGWDVRTLVALLRVHPQSGSRLFWLEGISDEYLEKLYASASCLIAASEGEGFGLPLIEAARHKLPILARDIPVFREVAGDHADYFTGLQPADLATGIKNWLALYRQGTHRKSDGMPWITWRQSAEQMVAALLLEQNRTRLDGAIEAVA